MRSVPSRSNNILNSLLLQTALVTGGGTGIGKAIAASLAANGAKVYIAARKESLLKEVSPMENAC